MESKFPNVQVKVTRVDPLGTIEQRASEFRRQVEEFATERVHIIGHSAGSLDARFLVSPNGSDMVRLAASITTIATPHRGIPVADWFEQPDREVADLIARFSRFAEGLRHLTTKAMEEFNKPGQRYSLLQLCGRAICRVGNRHSRLLHEIISRREGANDGLATVASARAARSGISLGFAGTTISLAEPYSTALTLS